MTQTTQTHSTWKHFNFLAIFAIFGIIIGFTACHKETKFEGTWTREDNRYQLVFNKKNYSLILDNGKLNNKGTFSFTEDELQIVTSHILTNDQWTKYASLSTVKYTLIDDNTFILNEGVTNTGSVFTGTWNKLSE
jgi:hypothetical protein